MVDPPVPVSGSRSSLIKPLDKEAILVPNERIYYGARQHWASIVQPLYERRVTIIPAILFATHRSP